jgi:threonine/homoserine/homoserine lactone efflux protein
MINHLRSLPLNQYRGFNREHSFRDVVHRLPMELIGLSQTQHLWLYFILVFGIIVLPGMDMAFVMASALVGGRSAGLTAVAGLVLGGAIHVAMSAVGVGLILKTVPQLFNAMLIAGAIYIAWIGGSLVLGASALGEIKTEQRRPLMATFVRAVLTCLLNPKAYVFMLAVFPQFLREEYGSIVVQAIALGLIGCATQCAVYGAVALLAAQTAAWLREHKTSQVNVGRAVGATLVATALWTAWQGWRMS